MTIEIRPQPPVTRCTTSPPREWRGQSIDGHPRTGTYAVPEAVASREGLTRRAALARLAAGAALVGTVDRETALAQATPAAQGTTPNQIALSGAETEITYEAQPGVGPRLTYVGPYGRHALAGNRLQSEACAVGRSITGSLGAFPDQGELWLTLVLPRFLPMTGADAPVRVVTAAILKWVISTIAGPPRSGALEEYRVIALEGIARVV